MESFDTYLFLTEQIWKTKRESRDVYFLCFIIPFFLFFSSFFLSFYTLRCCFSQVINLGLLTQLRVVQRTSANLTCGLSFGDRRLVEAWVKLRSQHILSFGDRRLAEAWAKLRSQHIIVFW